MLVKCLAQYLARKHLVNVALIVTGSFALPGLAAAVVRAQLCISVGPNVELNHAADWATKWLLSCSPAFLLEHPWQSWPQPYNLCEGMEAEHCK